MEIEKQENQKGHKMKFSRLRIIKNLTVISSAFVLLFTAYNGLSMLQSTMNKVQGVGTVSQAVVYISFGLSSLLLPNFIIKKLGTRTTLLFAIILYLPYIAANFYPMWITLIPSAVLTGIGASILWGSQCTYFNESSVIFCTLDEDGVVEILNHVGETSSIRTCSDKLSVCSSAYQSTEELSSSTNNSKCGIVNCQLSIRNIKRKSHEELNRKDSNNSNKSEMLSDSLKRQQQSKVQPGGAQNSTNDSLKRSLHSRNNSNNSNQSEILSDTLKRQHQAKVQPGGVQNSTNDSLKRSSHSRNDSNNSNKSDIQSDSLKRQQQAEGQSGGPQNYCSDSLKRSANNRKDSNKSDIQSDSLKRQHQSKVKLDGAQNNSSDSLKRTVQSDGNQNSKSDSLKRQNNSSGQQNDPQKKRQLSNINEEDISIIYKPKSPEYALSEDIHSYSLNGIPRQEADDEEMFETYAAIDSANACFFGCHGLAYYSAQIWSNLISFYILHENRPHNYTKIHGCACGADFCDPEPECVNDDIDYITLDTRYLLSGLSLGLGVIAALLILFFLDPLNKEKEPVTFSWKQVLATFHHSKKKEQLFLVPLSLYVGMAQGFYTADVTRAYIACAWGTSHVGLVTIFYGVACALSSTVSGCLVQFMGRIPIFLIGQIGNIINYAFLLMWSPEVHHPLMFYLAAAMWGIITGLFWSQLQAFYGVLFQGDEEAAFGSYYLYSSMGWTISFLYSNYLCTAIKIYILCSASCIGIIGYLITERNHHIRKKQMNEPD